GQSRQHDDRRLLVATQVVAAQSGDDRGDVLLESRHVLIAKVAMAGNADDQRQAVGGQFHKSGSARYSTFPDGDRHCHPNERGQIATLSIVEPEVNLDTSKQKVAALTAPRNAVVVGASDRAGSWAARVWHNLNRYQFP